MTALLRDPMHLDTIRRHATPEGVRIALRVAGPVVRLQAWLIDALGLTALGFIAAGSLAVFAGVGQGLLLITLFLLTWAYPVFFEVYFQGATPGKMIMKILVVQDDGTPVSFWSSAVRNLLRVADFLPAFYAIGLVSTLLTRDFQRLGDLAAGTVVIHAEGVLLSRPIQDVVAVAPPPDLELADARAIMDFAERLPTWTDERAAELADTIASVTGCTGRAGVDRLVGMANWLVGRR